MSPHHQASRQGCCVPVIQPGAKCHYHRHGIQNLPRTSIVVQWLKFPDFHCRGCGFNPWSGKLQQPEKLSQTKLTGLPLASSAYQLQEVDCQPPVADEEMGPERRHHLPRVTACKRWSWEWMCGFLGIVKLYFRKGIVRTCILMCHRVTELL